MRTFPIITVEVPHQYPSRAFIWSNERELLDYCDKRAATRSDDASLAYMDGPRDVDAALDYMRDDLHALDVWERSDVPTLRRAMGQHRHGDPRRTTGAIEHAIQLGWIGEQSTCADCGCAGVVCASSNGEIEVCGVLFDAPRCATVLAGSKRNGEPVCDDCEDARDESGGAS